MALEIAIGIISISMSFISTSSISTSTMSIIAISKNTISTNGRPSLRGLSHSPYGLLAFLADRAERDPLAPVERAPSITRLVP